MMLTDGAMFRKWKVARIYKFELLNNIGYIVATLVISMGLLSFELFREFMGLNRLLGPVVLGTIACLLAYFTSCFIVLKRHFRKAFDSLPVQEVRS
jgi:Na+/glutamate symporter